MKYVSVHLGKKTLFKKHISIHNGISQLSDQHCCIPVQYGRKPVNITPISSKFYTEQMLGENLQSFPAISTNSLHKSTKDVIEDPISSFLMFTLKTSSQYNDILRMYSKEKGNLAMR